MRTTPDERKILPFKTASAFERWLEKNNAKSDGIWLKFAKKDSGVKSVAYTEAVDVALCYGWIDGQSRKFDEQHWLQSFTPRRKRSMWSKLNRERVARLRREGRMQPPGEAEVSRAKEDGRWSSAYDSPKNSTVPADLAKALSANVAAKKFFATLNAANRYAVLWRVQTAKKVETRARRITVLVAMLERGEKLHP